MDRIKVVYLDTHVILWLYDHRLERLSPAVRRALKSSQAIASPAAVLELELLHEIGRIKPSAVSVIRALAVDFGLQICDLPFRTIVDAAIQEAWCRDPFDRLIVANAKAASAPLVTKDERILANYARALW